MEVYIAKCHDCSKMVVIVNNVRFGHKCSGLFHDVKGCFWKDSHPIEEQIAKLEAENKKMKQIIYDDIISPNCPTCSLKMTKFCDNGIMCVDKIIDGTFTNFAYKKREAEKEKLVEILFYKWVGFPKKLGGEFYNSPKNREMFKVWLKEALEE